MIPDKLEREDGLAGRARVPRQARPRPVLRLATGAGTSRHRLAIPGLYLCGSGAHPGGGLDRHPGDHAARAILADQSNASLAHSLAAATSWAWGRRKRSSKRHIISLCHCTPEPSPCRRCARSLRSRRQACAPWATFAGRCSPPLDGGTSSPGGCRPRTTRRRSNPARPRPRASDRPAVPCEIPPRVGVARTGVKLGDVLRQRPAVGDGQYLDAAANPQHRDAAVEGRAGQRQLEGVVRRVDRLGRGVPVLPVVDRVDVVTPHSCTPSTMSRSASTSFPGSRAAAPPRPPPPAPAGSAATARPPSAGGLPARLCTRSPAASRANATESVRLPRRPPAWRAAAG